MVHPTKRNLIIISVPFSRNTKYLLSSRIYAKLKDKYNLLIISPFANNDNFQQEFGGANVSFWKLDKDSSQLNFFAKKIYGISDNLRLGGYWFRYRNDKMRYYWMKSIDVDSKEYESWPKKYIIGIKSRIMGWLGYYKNLWRIIDRIFGNYLYNIEAFEKYVGDYKNVLLIQTANWGYQERFLAYCARRFSCKSVFMPYSSDQLSINGYLISDFDKIWSNGPLETEYAIKYHGIPLQRISKLGMLWFRNVDTILEENNIQRQNTNNKVKIIMYAGVASSFFKREWEFEALDKILMSIKNGIIPSAKIIYRPLPTSDTEINDIYNRYGKNDLIEINMPQVSCYGISQYTESNVKDEITDYIKVIASSNVMIMSYSTSIGWDALYLNKPVIANDACKAGAAPIPKRNLYREADIASEIAFGIPVVLSLNELIEKIKKALDIPSSYDQVKNNLIEAWDYKNADYVDSFMKVISELTV